MLAENYTNMISFNVYEVSEIRNVYSSPNIDNMFKIRKMRVAVQETHTGWEGEICIVQNIIRISDKSLENLGLDDRIFHLS